MTWEKFWCDFCQIWVDKKTCPHCGEITTYTVPDDEEDEDVIQADI